MAEKLEKKRWKKDELKAAFVRDHEERFRMHYRQQQLELQSKVQVSAQGSPSLSMTLPPSLPLPCHEACKPICATCSTSAGLPWDHKQLTLLNHNA